MAHNALPLSHYAVFRRLQNTALKLLHSSRQAMTWIEHTDDTVLVSKHITTDIHSDLVCRNV